MTVETTTKKVSANGNDTATIFSFDPIKIFESSDIEVTVLDDSDVETVLAEGTDDTTYSVQAASGTYPSALGVTGQITYPAVGGTPLATGWSITIKRVLPLLQETDLENQGGYFPDVQEATFDKSRMIDLQLEEQLERTLKGPVTDPTTIDDLPAVANRLNSTFLWDENGQPAAGGVTGTVISAAMLPVVQGSTLAIARAEMDVAQNTTFSRFVYTATAAQTVFTGADDNSNVMLFANSDALVYLNGLILYEGSSQDYTTTTGDTVTLVQAANVGDILQVFTIEAASILDQISQATADARYLQKTNNLSDLNNASTSRTNLGVAIGQDLDVSRAWSAWTSQDLTNGGADDTATWPILSSMSDAEEFMILFRSGSLTATGAIGITIETGGGEIVTNYACNGRRDFGSGATVTAYTDGVYCDKAPGAGNVYNGIFRGWNTGADGWYFEGHTMAAGQNIVIAWITDGDVGAAVTQINLKGDAGNFDGGWAFGRWR